MNTETNVQTTVNTSTESPKKLFDLDSHLDRVLGEIRSSH
jgi:hypothetical protein